jgi:hypothetical protein
VRDVETGVNPSRTGAWTSSLYQSLMFSSIFRCNWLSPRIVSYSKRLFSRMYRRTRVDTRRFGVRRPEYCCRYFSDIGRCKICTQTACLWNRNEKTACLLWTLLVTRNNRSVCWLNVLPALCLYEYVHVWGHSIHFDDWQIGNCCESDAFWHYWLRITSRLTSCSVDLVLGHSLHIMSCSIERRNIKSDLHV